MGDQPTPITITRADAARELRLSVQTIDRLIATGEMRAVRIGRRVVIPATEPARLISECTSEAD